MIALALLAVAPSAEASLEQVFFNACFNGEVRLNAQTTAEVDWDAVAPVLRYRKSDFVNSKIYRLSKPKLGFLIIGTNSSDPEKQRCAMASRSIDQSQVWDDLIKRGLPKGLKEKPQAGVRTYTTMMTYQAADGTDVHIVIGFDRLASGWRYMQTIYPKDTEIRGAVF
ncbi:MAG: hypothetical protein U1E64_01960 [Sphingomonadaceae bacterium]